MLNGVALRSQIASVVDALAKAAVAEIFKVVEDGMVVLRLEMCQREDEIERLKSSMEVLHGELRAARQAETHRLEHRGGDGERQKKKIKTNKKTLRCPLVTETQSQTHYRAANDF